MFHHLGRLADAVVVEHLCGQRDAGDGCFQLVCHVVDKVILDLRIPFLSEDDDDGDFRNSNDDMNKRTSLLFQVLDGVLSSSNLIVIATTNYFNRLDPALIRDRRFDYKIELKGLDYNTAVKVCERFGVDPADINLNEWKTPIAPATLQTVLLKYKITNVNTYDPSKVDDAGDEN